MISKRVREMIEEGLSYPLAESSEEKEFTKLCSNENPFGPPSKVINAIKKEAERIGEYPESSSIGVKEAISDYIGVNPLQICVGNGSDEIMDLACKATMNPGDQVLIPIPTFSQYELSCRSNAMVPKFVELDNYRWEVESLLEGLKDSKAAFIGRPNNPTGNSINNEGMKELLSTGKIIIVDEAYVEFSEKTSLVDWIEDYENLIVLRTFSKAFALAGIRIGYGVANREISEALERVRPPFSVNRLAQKAAVAALKTRDFLDRTRDTIFKEKEYLQKKLEKLGFEILPSDANFIMANPTPLGMEAFDICNYLSKQGILIRNLSGFRGAGSNWIRISVGRPEQNKRLIKAIEKIKEG